MTADLESEFPLPPRPRRVFCNRTLNLRTIRAIGFDMDYTLIHYHVDEWERRAYAYLRDSLAQRGWSAVSELQFDVDFAIPGLVLDVELGNVVKCNRFGYVNRACHGTQMLDFGAQREAYARVRVDLDEPRWVFLNTLFGLSEACMFAQLVDLFDRGALPSARAYGDLYRAVKQGLDEAHMEGRLKADIVAEPERFVQLDPECASALLDLRAAGKKLLLITNSEWAYTREIMKYAFDRYLPDGMTWRELFDVKIVFASKPVFFSGRQAFFDVLNEEGHLRPHAGRIHDGGTYLGGSAQQIERDLGLSGEEILYVGDHVYADVRIPTSLLRWRTCLVLRALEQEVEALERFEPTQDLMNARMEEKERKEHAYSQLRLQLQRLERGYGERTGAPPEAIRARMQQLRSELVQTDEVLAPLAREAGGLVNARWGPLLRAGADKSHLARQVERYGDIYTSRVSNFLAYTPFVYHRAARGSLPHDARPRLAGC